MSEFKRSKGVLFEILEEQKKQKRQTVSIKVSLDSDMAQTLMFLQARARDVDLSFEDFIGNLLTTKHKKELKSLHSEISDRLRMEMSNQSEEEA